VSIEFDMNAKYLIDILANYSNSYSPFWLSQRPTRVCSKSAFWGFGYLAFL